MPTLDWLNKEEAVTAAQQVPYRILDPVPELSTGEPGSNNMLIQGDNLEALKSLLPLYGGKVKCIYIDPPYNTRSAFEHYDDNLEHSVWLSMMYPRLELLRDLLSEDGSIWITLDDNESHYIKIVLDEIFGRKNFVANIAWQKKYSPGNNQKGVSSDLDHILAYAKNHSEWAWNLLPRSTKQDKAYKNPDDDPRGPWKPSDLTRAEYRERDYYEIETPSGRKVLPASGRSWSRPPEEIVRLRNDNRLWFGPDGNAKPSLKRFLSEVQSGVVAKGIWLREDVGDNELAKKESKLLNENDIFETPKPEKLLERVIHISSVENDIVLDSFLGSGTTAAVAHKMNRRYVGIEMGEHAVTHCQPRLQKVIEGEQGGISKAVEWKGGGGFNFFRLGEPVFDEYGHIQDGVSFKAFAQYLWFLETGTPLITEADSPLLGEFKGKAYYLLYNGILGDRRPQGGNVLTSPILNQLPAFDGPKVIFGESTRLGDARLEREKIVFRQIPYDVGSK